MCIHTYLAPILAINLVNSAMPPGRSLTVTTKRTRRPSAASPRSKHLPNTVESMFPPHSAITTLQSNLFTYVRFVSELPEKVRVRRYHYLFPFNSGTRPARQAARPVEPAPSIVAFSSSTNRNTARAIYSSLRKTNITLIINPGSEVRNPGSGVQNPGSGVRNPGSGVRNPGSGVRNPGSGIQNPGSGIQEVESGIQEVESGIQEVESGIQEVESGIQTSWGFGIQIQGNDRKNLESRIHGNPGSSKGKYLESKEGEMWNLIEFFKI